MKKSTGELLDILKNTSNLDSFFKNQQENMVVKELSEYLDKLLAEKKLSKSECIKRSGLDRTYAYQIFSGIKKPSRDKLLSLCIGMELTYEEVQSILNQTGYPTLYARNNRDSVLIFAISHRLSVTDTNTLLFDKDFLPL